MMSTVVTVPVLIYDNPDENKSIVVKENRKKTGVYSWIHKETGRRYVGSSVNLGKRLSEYYNYNHLSSKNMIICKALLKYGYSGFKLEILEYCSIEELINKEQYYINKYKPEFNILKLAGSSLGFKHSEASKELMSQLAKGRCISKDTLIKMKNKTVSEDIRKKISATLQGRKFTPETLQHMSDAALGRKASEQTKLKLALNNNKRQIVKLTNVETGELKEFLFVKQAAEYLKTSHTQIRNYYNKNKSYKGYIINISKPSDSID
uniref:GIY-YIG endonuclease n=1 Tax=Hirsutella minnesotensis TaxID=332947 RepID=A0A0U2ET99_9HYPO|nr:GIY-YIG endonuclease [Hirsutella minnesotensis]AKR17989.1 GIY-YIG endonuclease [Hirsutella minnesotensis]